MSTIREVAAHAGVSPATVSRVINHDTRYKMTDETRERVWQAVAELNYKAPVSSQEQMNFVKKATPPQGTVHRFGCVLRVRGGKYNDPYFLTILSGFEKAIMEKGYEVAFIRTDDEFEDKQLLYNTFSSPVAGLIIMNTLSDEVFDYVCKQTPNIVGIDTEHTSIDNVGYDHYSATSIAVKHLYEKGYRKIGYIGGAADRIKSSKRFKGYYSTLNQLGLEYNPDWILASNWSEDECASAVKEAQKKGIMPEVYLAASDLMAIAALRALFDLGISVPGECAVMGLSNIEIAKYSNPPLTTIGLPIYDMGRVAANVLLDRINGDDTPKKVVNLGAEIVERSSI